MPPTPSARSTESEPVGMTIASSSAPDAPSFMTAPLPNWRSIWESASSRACRRSLSAFDSPFASTLDSAFDSTFASAMASLLSLPIRVLSDPRHVLGSFYESPAPESTYLRVTVGCPPPEGVHGQGVVARSLGAQLRPHQMDGL